MRILDMNMFCCLRLGSDNSLKTEQVRNLTTVDTLHLINKNNVKVKFAHTLIGWSVSVREMYEDMRPSPSRCKRLPIVTLRMHGCQSWIGEGHMS